MLYRDYRLCLVCAIALAVIAALMMLGQPPAAKAAAAKVSFINDVAPILKESCYACHDAKKKSGKLVMTSYASLRTGGTNDDPIVPGKPEDSELFNVLHAEGERMMPPKDKGGPLPQAKVRIIERWIREGGHLDADIDPNADLLRELRKRWQPPTPYETYPAAMAVNALAFTPDGERLVAGGHYELTVWQVSTGRLVQRVRTRAERAYGLAFLPNGLLAVAGGRPGQEGDVRVYDLNAPGTTKDGVARLDGVKDLRVMVAHLFDTDDCVLGLALSKDGKLLAAGGCDRAARVWDISPGVKSAKLIHTVETHADWVLGVAFTPDGKQLLTAGRDKTAKVYDLVKKEPVASFPEHQAIVNGVVARADGKVAYSVGADRNLYVWKLEGEAKSTRRATGHTDEVVRVATHPSVPMVVTASADKTLRTWKEDGNPGRVISGLPDTPFALAISPNGQKVAAAGYGGEVRVWNFKDGSQASAFSLSPGLKNSPQTK